MSRLVFLFSFVFLLGCGADGENGKDGNSCSVNKTTNKMVCTDGSQVDLPRDGVDGTSGVDGKDGEDGLAYEERMSTILAKVTSHLKSVLDIECDDGASYWRGTGTLVTGGKILTANHVTDGATSCYYYQNGTYVGGGGSPSQVGSRDQEYILSPSLNATGLALPEAVLVDDYIPKRGDLLIGMTHPGFLNDNVQVTTGEVAAESMSSNELGSYSTYWEGAFTTTDAAMAGGSSGGPIFDENGNIVAILVGGAVDTSLELAIVLPLD